jgi:hypothetical protein
MASERVEQASFGGQTKQLLIVVLPDGKVVNPITADRF